MRRKTANYIQDDYLESQIVYCVQNRLCSRVIGKSRDIVASVCAISPHYFFELRLCFFFIISNVYKALLEIFLKQKSTNYKYWISEKETKLEKVILL